MLLSTSTFGKHWSPHTAIGCPSGERVMQLHQRERERETERVMGVIIDVNEGGRSHCQGNRHVMLGRGGKSKICAKDLVASTLPKLKSYIPSIDWVQSKAGSCFGLFLDHRHHPTLCPLRCGNSTDHRCTLCFKPPPFLCLTYLQTL